MSMLRIIVRWNDIFRYELIHMSIGYCSISTLMPFNQIWNRIGFNGDEPYTIPYVPTQNINPRKSAYSRSCVVGTAISLWASEGWNSLCPHNSSTTQSILCQEQASHLTGIIPCYDNADIPGLPCSYCWWHVIINQVIHTMRINP